MSIHVGLRGPGHLARVVSVATGGPVINITPNALKGAGTSRIALGVGSGMTGTQGSPSATYMASWCAGIGEWGNLPAAFNNICYATMGGNFGLTSSTSENLRVRDSVASNAATGNPAGVTTSVSADAQYSVKSDGTVSPLAHPANFAVLMPFANDALNAGSFYTGPAVSFSIGKQILDDYEAADHLLLLTTDAPRGQATVFMEAHTGFTNGPNAFQASVTPTVGFKDGTDYGFAAVVRDGPVVMSKVTTPSGPNEYAVDANGNYSTYSGGGGPTTMWVTYCSGAVVNPGSKANAEIIRAWLKDATASFTYNAVSYGVPGARYNRNNIIFADTSAAVTDPVSSDLKPFMSADGTHLSPDGNRVEEKVMADAVAATPLLAAMPSKLPYLTGGMYDVATSNASAKVVGSSGGTKLGVPLPPSMIASLNAATAGNLRFTYGAAAAAGPAGIVTCSDIDGAHGRLAGTNVDASANGASNIVTYATGGWEITFLANIGNLTHLYADMDPANCLPNPYLEIVAGDISALPGGMLGPGGPKNWTVSSDAPANCTIAQLPGGRGVRCTLFGVGGTNMTMAAINTPIPNRVNPVGGDQLLAFCRRTVRPGPDGHLYGLSAAKLRTLATITPAINRGSFYPAVTTIGAVMSEESVNRPYSDLALLGGDHFTHELLSPPIGLLTATSLTGISLQLTAVWSKAVSATVDWEWVGFKTVAGTNVD